MRTHIQHLRSFRLLLPAAALLVAGCFKLSRESPRLQIFALGGATPASTANISSGAASPVAPTRTGLVIGLRRLDLASYLSSTPAVVWRRGANQLVVSEFHRWGGDLDEGINRAFAAHLARIAPVQAVDVAPWQTRVRHDFVLQLHVSRFEGVADSAATEGRIHVMAGWDIIRPLDGTLLLRGTSEDRGTTWRVGDYAGLVTQLDGALLRIARDVSACLARFPNDSTPPTSCASATGAGAPGAP